MAQAGSKSIVKTPLPAELREAWRMIARCLGDGGSAVPVKSEVPGDLPFRYELSGGRVVAGDVLERFAEAGMLKRTFEERVYLCPECWGSAIWFREVCPGCGGAGLERDTLYHHFRCGAVFGGSDAEDVATCPKCRVALRDVGVDFEVQQGEFHCVTCERVSSMAPTAGRCARCDARFGAERAVETDWHAYGLLAGAILDEANDPAGVGQGLTALARLAESRDAYLGRHVERVRKYSRVLMEALAHRGASHEPGLDEAMEHIDIAAELHDLGNVGISERVLGKRGPLSDWERGQVRSHVLNGAKWLSLTDDLQTPGMAAARRVVQHHHERWDGAGYPDGLSGETIPLEARVVAVADAFDAMTTPRAYRDGLSVEEALLRIQREAGRQFDPTVVQALADRAPQIEEIHRSLSDGE